MTLRDALDPVGQLGFPQAVEFEGGLAKGSGVGEPLGQQRADPGLEQFFHLPGHAGQEDERFALFLEVEAAEMALRLERGGAARSPGHFLDPLHRPPPGLGRGLDQGVNVRVAVERSVEHPGRYFGGQVVVGRAQAAGDDQKIGPLQGLGQRLGHGVFVVADRGYPFDRQPQGGQSAGQKMGVGVHHPPVDDFIADNNQFTFIHGRIVTPGRPGCQAG